MKTTRYGIDDRPIFVIDPSQHTTAIPESGA